MTIIIIFFAAHWYLSLFSQTFFDHRYAAHGAFTMNKPWERFFYLFAYITQGSSYMSPAAYAILHRMHHAYADTEKDPHSPMNDSNLFSLMWKTRTSYFNIFKDRVAVEDKFLKNLPRWQALDNFGHTVFSRVMWVAAYAAFYFAFAPSYWFLLLVPVHALMGPIHGTIINWYAHKYGKAHHKVDNTAKNLFPVDILMMGEAYHNNHHKFPSRINFGMRWYQLDPVYPVIRLLSFARVVKVNRQEIAATDREF